MTPSVFIERFIKDHEGGLSMDPADNGNWFDTARLAKGLPQRRNYGKLVGSKYGITAYALAEHRGVKNITAGDIANLKIEEAVAIGVRSYINRPGFDKLPWNRVVAAAVDAGWMSGPTKGIELLQRACGADDDGNLGPLTVCAFKIALDKHGEGEMALRLCAERKKFYQILATNEGPNDPDRRFINGWRNRADSFLPGTKWWNAW